VTAEQLQTMINNLTTAIGTGTLRAKDADGKEHWYRSVNDMLTARKVLESDLAKLSSTCRKRRALNIHTVGVR
jgi:hypothetical protein